MNIVFLDIDGPMLSGRAWVPWILGGGKGNLGLWDPIGVAMVNSLLREAPAQLVISSTWKILGYEEFCDHLKKNQMDPKYLHEDWKTPRKFSSTRSDEVHLWLEEHPEVQKWVSFDDVEVYGEGAITVSFSDGITLDAYSRAREIFGLDPFLVLG